MVVFVRLAELSIHIITLPFQWEIISSKKKRQRKSKCHLSFLSLLEISLEGCWVSIPALHSLLLRAFISTEVSLPQVAALFGM